MTPGFKIVLVQEKILFNALSKSFTLLPVNAGGAVIVLFLLHIDTNYKVAHFNLSFHCLKTTHSLVVEEPHSVFSISPNGKQQSQSLQQGDYSCQNEHRSGWTLLGDKRSEETSKRERQNN